jgi:hypothetical protein
MHTRKRLSLLFAACAAALIIAGGGSAITNGQPDEGRHPYVGLLVTFDTATGFFSACSGSLLSEDVFLTAGHCTDGADAAWVWFDEIWPASLASADAIGTAHTYDGYCVGCGKAGIQGDVGVVTFDAVPGSLPTQRASLPTPNRVDSLRNKTPIDFVGFGVTFQAKIPGNVLPPPPPPPYQRWDGLGTRLYAPSELVSSKSALSPEFLKLAMNPGGGSGGLCFGDSGGPALLGGTNTVLGINSFVNNWNCAGIGHAQRVDAPEVLEWIGGFL